MATVDGLYIYHQENSKLLLILFQCLEQFNGHHEKYTASSDHSNVMHHGFHGVILETHGEC